MTGIGVSPAFIWPSEREDALCVPPAGPFDIHCPALKWEPRKYGATTYQSVFIPTSRFHDFIEGEQQRSGCSFYRQKTGPKTHEETPDAPPADEVI